MTDSMHVYTSKIFNKLQQPHSEGELTWPLMRQSAAFSACTWTAQHNNCAQHVPKLAKQTNKQTNQNLFQILQISVYKIVNGWQIFIKNIIIHVHYSSEQILNFVLKVATWGPDGSSCLRRVRHCIECFLLFLWNCHESTSTTQHIT